VGGRRESGFRRLPSRSHSSTRLHRNLTLSKLASCDAADIKSAEGREQNSLYVSSSSKVVSSLPHRPSRAVLVLLALAEQRRLNRLVNRAQVVDVGELFASEPLASVQSKQRRGTGEEGETNLFVVRVLDEHVAELDLAAVDVLPRDEHGDVVGAGTTLEEGNDVAELGGEAGREDG
jgi:hypothetical protein